MKAKKCKVCEKKFTPLRPLQSVCCGRCGIEHSYRLKEKASLKESSELASQKIKLRTDSLNQTLQKLVNKIVREIDRECTCISCGTKMVHNTKNTFSRNAVNAGHFVSVGSNNSLRFHLFNIWAQCINCNKDKWGNGAEYAKGLSKTFEPSIFNYIIDLGVIYPELKLIESELKEAIIKTKNILKEIEAQNEIDFLPRKAEERVRLRKEFNLTIGIY
jgi:transcriptional regulator NrdR family protein